MVVGARLESCKYLIEVEACNSKPPTCNIEGTTGGNIEGTTGGNIEGTTGGNIEGTTGGNIKGQSGGNIKGTTEGNIKGTSDGNVDTQTKKPTFLNQTESVARSEASSTRVAKPVARVGLKRKHTVSIDTIFIKYIVTQQLPNNYQ